MKSIKELKAESQALKGQALQQWLIANQNDKRAGVQSLIKSHEKKLAKRQALEAKLKRLSDFDASKGQLVIGLDEAGRGPLAGPVVAAACIIKADKNLLGLDDSKKLSAEKRDELFEIIKAQALYWGIGIIDAVTIDKINILEASKLAMYKALENADIPYDAVLTDYVFLEHLKAPLYAEVKGDQKSLAIAAASVLAKVTRDRLLEELDKTYPQYGFAQHKGYGTKQHYQAIAEYGIIEKIHRKTFLKNY